MKKEIRYWVDSKDVVQRQIETFLKNNMDFKMQSRKHGIYQKGKVTLIYKNISKVDKIERDKTPFIHTDCFEALRNNKDEITDAFRKNKKNECAESLSKTIKCIEELINIEAPNIKRGEFEKDEWIQEISNFQESDNSKALDFYQLHDEIDREFDEFKLLGSYNRSTNEVKLFLDVILDWAIMLDIDPFLAFKFTFCHEMAHKFHHIGLDEEGRNWELNYGHTDIDIKEGLAQWYTMKYAKETDHNGYKGWKESKTRKTLLASDQLEKESDNLPKTYQYYRNWTKFSLEAIRICIIESRQNNVKKTKDFDKILNDHHLRSI